MSEDDPTLPNERLGRWIPRYSGPAHRGRFGRFRSGGADFEVAGTLAVLGLLAILALVGVIVSDLPRSDSRKAAPHGAALPVPPEFSQPPLLPPLVSAPPPSGPTASAPPLPPGSAAGTAQTRAPGGTAPATNRPRTPRPPATTAPGGARLVVGATVTLEAARRPGNRVRHRNFRARIDPIGPGSGAGDRADATFSVRSGLTGGRGCVSLEATNFPHRFLRHQNFAVFLHRDDGSALFAADATFCPVQVGGGALVLRSVNYPNQYVTERDSQLFLDLVSPGAALALSVRSPLASAAALGGGQLVSGRTPARFERGATHGTRRCGARSARAHRHRCNRVMTYPAGSSRRHRSPAG
jgi:alpha-L-arabinofuranosidase B-like protein